MARKIWLVCALSPENAGAISDYEVRIDRKDKVDSYHLREDSANEAAKKLAVENPGKQYGVFGISKVFETTQPKFVEKVFNERGELVPL